VLRITFANSNTGTGSYTVYANPVAIEMEGGDGSLLSDNLDSRPTKYNFVYDDRPLSLVWRNHGADNVNFSGLVDVLLTYREQDKWVKWGDVSPLFRDRYAGTGWHSFYVDDVVTKVREGGGKIFDEVKVILYEA
jgi:hypothetical protein